MVKTDQGKIILTDGAITCEFNKFTGQPIRFENLFMSMTGSEIYIDIGCNGSMQAGILEFDCLDNKNTWELPRIKPVQGSAKGWVFTGCSENENILQLFYRTEGMEVILCYSIVCGSLSLSVDIKNITEEKQTINGVAFVLKDKDMNDDAAFEFPGNVPFCEFKFGDLNELSVIETGLINPVIHKCTGEKHMNLIFLDREEKWGTGVYKENSSTLTYINFAAVESYLNPGETLHCGNAYIQLIGKNDPYKPVRELYKHFGWVPADNGISDGVMYSCHPAGTMDANFPYGTDKMKAEFPYKGTMYEYADELQRLKEIGIDHVWVLPIFDHKDRGVYHPTDQAVIDERYGGDEAVRQFCDRAHELGMTVLFDYVPHGPAPEDNLAKEHIEWCSVDREGKLKIEWNCVSFDMADPNYQDYHRKLVKDHIRRFGIDGSRIDCAMGGLTNWKPFGSNRPSNSNLKGGVEMSGAIRQAFLECEKKPVVTPENFNPLPMYYEHTDIFYDMPLYRVLCELEDWHLSPKEFAHNLTRWLNAELLTTPEGYSKMRFLGNHDTVSWVFQKARAPKVYGEAKAKALWVLISVIDGMPMLYQGDEDPELYNGEGPELREFFKGLFSARKTYLGNKYDMEYEFTNSSIVSFKRSYDKLSRRVLINFSPEKEVYEGNLNINNILYGNCSVENNRIVLDGYGYVVLDI